MPGLSIIPSVARVFIRSAAEAVPAIESEKARNPPGFFWGAFFTCKWHSG